MPRLLHVGQANPGAVGEIPLHDGTLACRVRSAHLASVGAVRPVSAEDDGKGGTGSVRARARTRACEVAALRPKPLPRGPSAADRGVRFGRPPIRRGLMEGGPEVREHVDRGHGTTWHSTARHGMEEHRVTAQIRGLWNRSVGPRESGTARM